MCFRVFFFKLGRSQWLIEIFVVDFRQRIVYEKILIDVD